MCRALTDGGRRCPCTYGLGRSKYRKGGAGVREARSHIIGAGGHPAPEPAAVEDIEPTWDDTCQRIAGLADDVTVLNVAVKPSWFDGGHSDWSDVQNSIQQRLADQGITDDAAQVHSRQGQERAAYQASVQVGELVAAEAEKRAGVTAEQIRDSYQARKRELAVALIRDTAPLARIAEERQTELDAAKERWNAANAALTVVNTPPIAVDELVLTPEWAEKGRCLMGYNEKMRQWRQADNDAKNLRPEHARIVAGAIDSQAKQDLAALSAAYLQVLDEVRPMGGDFTWHPKTMKKAQEAFGEVSGLYPSDWVAASNSNPVEMLAKVATSRAHYSHGHYQDVKKRVRSGRLRSFESFEGAPLDDVYTTWTAQPDDPDRPYSKMFKSEDWEVSYNSSYNPFNADRPPRGRGWKIWTNPNDTTDQRWRRPRTRMQLQRSERVAEIKTNSNGRGDAEGMSGTAATCAHELAHRMERTVGGIRPLERAFLDDRCGDAPRISLYGGRLHRGRQELSRPDGFVSAYMGKVYPAEDDGQGPYTEVMSMGMESVFTGSNGGLIGLGKFDPDLHMRSFVLGTLLTAGHDQPATLPSAATPAGERELVGSAHQ